MEGGRILSEASLKHVVTDRNVVVRNGRTMMGHENYPDHDRQKLHNLSVFCKIVQGTGEKTAPAGEMFVEKSLYCRIQETSIMKI